MKLTKENFLALVSQHGDLALPAALDAEAEAIWQQYPLGTANLQRLGTDMGPIIVTLVSWLEEWREDHGPPSVPS